MLSLFGIPILPLVCMVQFPEISHEAHDSDDFVPRMLWSWLCDRGDVFLTKALQLGLSCDCPRYSCGAEIVYHLDLHTGHFRISRRRIGALKEGRGPLGIVSQDVGNDGMHGMYTQRISVTHAAWLSDV
jgi:hypothetical protein